MPRQAAITSSVKRGHSTVRIAHTERVSLWRPPCGTPRATTRSRGWPPLPTIQPGIGPHEVAGSAGIRLPTAYPQTFEAA
jgi:hypothetical protein